jgi:hypothetical protein
MIRTSSRSNPIGDIIIHPNFPNPSPIYKAQAAIPMTTAATPPNSAWLPTAALWEAEAEAEAADLEALALALRDAEAEAEADPVMEAISEDATLRREERMLSPC